ncbi:MAG: hypothetical protein Q9165_004452, partial [Trypethelium subeluteriae]
MSLNLAIRLGALMLCNGASARALPQIQPIVISNGVGANAAAGAAATVGGAVGTPALPTIPLPTNGAQVGVPVPVVSFSTSTASIGGNPPPTIKLPPSSAAGLPAVSLPINPSIPTTAPLLPPVPLSPGPLSPLIQGTLNAPIIQNTDPGALTTLLSINAPVIGGTYGGSGLPSLPIGNGLPTGVLPVTTGIGGLPTAVSTIPAASGIISTLSNLLFGLIEAILPNQAGNVVSSVTSAASIPAISALPNPALPGVPDIPVPLAPPVQLADASNVPNAPLPASSLLSVTNVSALTAHFPTLSPRSPQVNTTAGSLALGDKAAAILPGGAAAALPTAALPGIPAGLPPLPAVAPPLPTGVPSVPSVPLSLPAAVPSVPAVVPSLPDGVPSVPSGLPSLPAGVPSLPAGVPSVPTGVLPLPTGVPALSVGVPSLPAGVPPLPTGVPSLPTGLVPVPSGVPSLPSGVLSSLPTGALTGIPVPSGALPSSSGIYLSRWDSCAPKSSGFRPYSSGASPNRLTAPRRLWRVGPSNLELLCSVFADSNQSALPLPPQLDSVDTAIGAATEKLGESEPLSDQTDTLLGLLSVLGTENPAAYGSLASLT